MSDYYNIIDSAEKIALKKGLEIGHEQGLAEGLEQGRAEGREEGLEQGREEGREEGLEQGREEGKLTTAAKLKALGVDPALISEATGLSADVVGRLS